jgi:hypothetical protein
MSQSFCTECGSALAPGAAFCGACGTAVDAGAAPAAAAEAPASAPPPGPAPPAEPAAAPTPVAEAYAAPPAPPPPAPAAPTYAPAQPAPQAAGVAAGSLTDPAHAQLVRAYVGPNADFYIAKWQQIAAAGKPNSWNWAAFLLNAFWLAYRRMWQPALGTLGAILALQLLGLFAPSLALLTDGLILGVCAWIGWRGNAIYLNHSERAVAQSATSAPDPNARIAWLQAQGGAAMGGAIVLAAAFAAIWFLLIFVIAAQMGLGRGYRSSSSYGASSYGSSTSSSSAAPLSEDWITDEYLEGSQWAPNCYGAGAYIRFNPNKTFTSSVGSGSWTQFGGVLTLSYSGGQPSETMTLHKAGPNQFTFTEANRSGTFNRCA